MDICLLCMSLKKDSKCLKCGYKWASRMDIVNELPEEEKNMVITDIIKTLMRQKWINFVKDYEDKDNVKTKSINDT